MMRRKLTEMLKLSSRPLCTYQKIHSEAHKLKIDKLKQELLSMFRVSVSAVLPCNLVRKVVRQSDSNYFIINGKTYFVNHNVYIVGFGKAVVGMALEVLDVMGDHIVRGVLSVPQGTETTSEAKQLVERNIEVRGGAAGNLPDQNAEDTAKIISEFVESLQSGSILIVLVSGGGSALLPAPVSGISVDDKASLIFKLQSKGASIQEINCVRKKLSFLKGGKLAIKALPAVTVTLILSDVIGNPLDLIASGPTVRNDDPPNRPLEIIKKYNLLNKIPSTVRVVLNRKNEMEERSRSAQDLLLSHIQNILIGSNRTALEAARDAASEMNYLPVIVSDEISSSVVELSEWYCKFCCTFCDAVRKGDDKDLAKFLSSTCKPHLSKKVVQKILHCMTCFLDDKVRGLCIIGGGEPTVTLPPNCVSKGGRSQELAIRFSYLMHNCNYMYDFLCVLMAAGTDGIDGPTDAAGAFGYPEQVQYSIQKHLDIKSFINHSNSYEFLSLLPEDMIKVGHTGTNVMDIHILLIKKSC